MSGRELEKWTSGAPKLVRRGRRYDATARASAVEYARRQLEDGASKAAIARALGTTAPTLDKWMKAAVFVPVEVMEAPPRAVVVHGPAGIRIEGLSVVELAELVRRLG